MGCWMRARTSTITTVENFLEQRVFKTGVANSIHYARVLIRQRHIRLEYVEDVDCATSFSVQELWSKVAILTRRNQKAAARKAAGGGDRDEDDEE
ncbi:hypothetical protein LguiA_000359 [Lonicera macranthoides]